MKFINYLTSISGISIFPLLGLLVFFVFFTGMIWYVYTADKKSMDAQRNLPLD